MAFFAIVGTTGVGKSTAVSLLLRKAIAARPDLRVLISGMGKALKPIGSMAAMTLLLLFVYGMIGVQLFGDEIPERWGNIGSAMLTLFTVLTLEGWNEILFRAQDVTQFAWVFLVSFVLLASFLVINILIAVIINSVEEAREEERAEEIIARIHLTESGALDEDPVASLIDRVGEMKRGLGEIEIELGTLSRTGTGDRDTDT